MTPDELLQKLDNIPIPVPTYENEKKKIDDRMSGIESKIDMGLAKEEWQIKYYKSLIKECKDDYEKLEEWQDQKQLKE
jgi:hypothetical protein